MTVETRYAHSPEAVAAMDTAALRAAFVADRLFVPGAAAGIHVHHDRIVALGIVPTTSPIALPNPDAMRAEHLLQRREAGVLNVGASGTVVAGGEELHLDHTEAAYLGRGTREVTFHSDDTGDPAAFYVFTAIAHVAHPTVRIPRARMRTVDLGDAEHANRRTLHQCVVEGVTPSASIAFGFTTIHSGSVWNTLPPHTHDRRTECYLYFDLPPQERVLHVLGRPEETRHVVLADRDLVVSPSWSVHFGAGTGAYSFAWGTAGENATYDDMDHVGVPDLR